MKNLFIALIFCLLFASACNNEKKSNSTGSVTLDSAKTSNADTLTKPVDSASVMKAWENYMNPGEAHTLMAKWVGKWNVELTFYNVGSKPTTATAIANYKTILGGRYLQCDYSGNIDGTPFEGKNTTAFDNSRKIFLSTWIDNMGTGLMYMEGTWNEKTKTIHFKGKANDVITGKEFGLRETHTIIDDNNQLMEMFDIKDGKETKSMMIKLTR